MNLNGFIDTLPSVDPKEAQDGLATYRLAFRAVETDERFRAVGLGIDFGPERLAILRQHASELIRLGRQLNVAVNGSKEVYVCDVLDDIAAYAHQVELATRRAGRKQRVPS